MHELGIAENALRAALAEARSANATQVLRLVVRVGALTGVDPEALQFAFAAIRADTLAAEAELAIEPVPATAECSGCGMRFTAPDGLFSACPTCGNIGATLRQGRELELVRVEFARP